MDSQRPPTLDYVDLSFTGGVHSSPADQAKLDLPMSSESDRSLFLSGEKLGRCERVKYGLVLFG